MATRSLIVIEEMKEGEKVYSGCYCHWDGYPNNNGKILLNNYTDRERVRKLISLGEMSSLGKYISPEECGQEASKHTFDDPIKDVTVYYGRDRGESDTAPFETQNLDPIIDDTWAEYVYVFGLDDKWYAMAAGYPAKPLADVFVRGEGILFEED